MSALPPQPLSPLDGRYFATVSELGDYLSEAGLNRARVEVEVEWLLALTDRSLFGTSPVSDADRTRLFGRGGAGEEDRGGVGVRVRWAYGDPALARFGLGRVLDKGEAKAADVVGERLVMIGDEEGHVGEAAHRVGGASSG